ncbi:MAG: citramalate synthase, partial [Thermoleophilia bacterium]
MSGQDVSGQVQIYDTTLRDGMQQEGMSVSVEEKVRIALKLDELGIHYIEGGFPASNPKEVEFFARMEHEHLTQARLVAFGMTRRKGVAAADDANLRVLAEAQPQTICIVGKTWGLHLTKVLHVSRDENLRMIDESVRFL